jgi:hypothetical protein
MSSIPLIFVLDARATVSNIYRFMVGNREESKNNFDGTDPSKLFCHKRIAAWPTFQR